MKKVILVSCLVLLFIGGYYYFTSHKVITQNTATLQQASVTLSPETKTSMKITSTVFSDHAAIPAKYTCDGQSINPPLSFQDVPANAKSLALLMDDPDVPKNIKPDGVFDHWVVYNIPPSVHEIAENSVPTGVSQGLNGAGQKKYTGPCPPDREHRYFFTLYALDTTLQFVNPAKVTKQMVIDAMKGHVIQEAVLIGVYNRPQNK